MSSINSRLFAKASRHLAHNHLITAHFNVVIRIVYSLSTHSPLMYYGILPRSSAVIIFGNPKNLSSRVISYCVSSRTHRAHSRTIANHPSKSSFVSCSYIFGAILAKFSTPSIRKALLNASLTALLGKKLNSFPT